MTKPVFGDIDVFCPVIRVKAVLTLRMASRVVGDFVSGSPTTCSSQQGCSCGVGCLLRAIRICTPRRKRKTYGIRKVGKNVNLHLTDGAVLVNVYLEGIEDKRLRVKSTRHKASFVELHHVVLIKSVSPFVQLQQKAS